MGQTSFRTLVTNRMPRQTHEVLRGEASRAFAEPSRAPEVTGQESASTKISETWTRLQAGQGYGNTLNCVLTVYRNESVAGFFKGMAFPLASIAVYNSVVFGVFSNTQRLLSQLRYGDAARAPALSDMALASAVAGFVSVGIGTPVDLIKIRLQMQTQPLLQARRLPGGRSCETPAKPAARHGKEWDERLPPPAASRRRLRQPLGAEFSPDPATCVGEAQQEVAAAPRRPPPSLPSWPGRFRFASGRGCRAKRGLLRQEPGRGRGPRRSGAGQLRLRRFRSCSHGCGIYAGAACAAGTLRCRFDGVLSCPLLKASERRRPLRLRGRTPKGVEVPSEGQLGEVKTHGNRARGLVWKAH
ncbi:solute carrier family 25 member 48 isoform X7 [Rhea pennata]|uniref:solute carrier family 25 member 48 isoform X7 n=1 Tax=Rhea pennata TaxID=8795 RepID=UPI002E263E04